MRGDSAGSRRVREGVPYPVRARRWTEAVILAALAVLCLIGTVVVREAFGRRHALGEVLWTIAEVGVAKARACAKVHHIAPDERCHFIRDVCRMETLGKINYLEWYYCSPSRAAPFTFIGFVLWLVFLFAFVGIAASDFFCPNLSTIASSLHMSESIAGVTFLAFGNGSPDVFSTLSAMKAGSGTLAIGELFGAACFIVSVVTGSMILVKPFKVNSTILVRDTLFFVGAVSAVLGFLADGQLRIWETLLLIAYYIAYVLVVILGGLYAKRRARKQSSVDRARSQYRDEDSPHLSIYNPNAEEEDIGAYEEFHHSSGDITPAEEYAELTAAMSTRHPGALQSNGQMILTPVSDRAEYFDAAGAYAETSTAQQNRKRRTTIVRPSLVGAVEFRDVVHALQSSSGARHLHFYGDSLKSPNSLGVNGGAGHFDRRQSQRSHTTPHNQMPTLSTLDRRHSLQDESVINLSADARPQLGPAPPARSKSRSTSDGQIIPNLEMTDQLDSIQWPSSGPLAHTSWEQASSPTSLQHASADGPLILLNEENVDPWRGAVKPVTRPALHLQMPPSGRDREKYLNIDNRSNTPTIVLSPAESPDEQPEPGYSTPAIALSQSRKQSIPESSWPTWNQSLRQGLKILFPTLVNFKQKSVLGMVLSTLSTPAIVLLTVTLPVVDEEDLSQSRARMLARKEGRGPINLPENNDSVYQPSSRDSAEQVWDRSFDRATEQRNERVAHALRAPLESSEKKNSTASWPRNLTSVQLCLAPILVVSSLLEPDSSWLWVLGAAMVGLIASILSLALLSPYVAPYRLQCCLMFLGFLVAMIWIMTIVNEVVGVLQAIGIIVGISDAILGLTIFAMGNSLGDLVSNVTVARMGFPTMALSACFGGPLLNLLLGIGMGGTYKYLTTRQPFEIEISTTLLVAGGGLVTFLLLTLSVVAASNWVMTRRLGCALLGLYLLLLIAITIAEIRTSV